MDNYDRVTILILFLALMFWIWYIEDMIQKRDKMFNEIARVVNENAEACNRYFNDHKSEPKVIKMKQPKPRKPKTK